MYRSVFVGIFGDNFMIIIWIDEDAEDGEDDKDEDCNDEDANLTELLVRSRVVGFKSGGGGGSRVYVPLLNNDSDYNCDSYFIAIAMMMMPADVGPTQKQWW